MGNNSILHVGLDGKAAEVAVTEVSRGVAGWFRPRQIKKVAIAEAEASVIRAKADAESAIIHAEAETKILEIQQRAQHRRLTESIRDQKNLEEIGRQTQLLLPAGSSPSDLGDDWMANFVDKARLISDEQMQQLWSRLLAGEISRPGTFSRRTINAIYDLDHDDCVLFTKLCSFCCSIGKPEGDPNYERAVPVVFDISEPLYKNNGITFDSLRHLDDIGLISLTEDIGITVSNPEEIPVAYFHEKLVLRARGATSVPIGTTILTKIGRQLEPIAGAMPVVGFKEYLLRHWGGFLRPQA